MSRLYNQLMMEQYGDLELANELQAREHDAQVNEAWEKHEAEDDLYAGIIENNSYEFYWLDQPETYLKTA